MNRKLLAALGAVAAIAAATGHLTGCTRPPETLEAVAARLPAAVGELRAAGADATYLPATIFSYLDGGAEVYLAYNLVRCHARRYAGEAIEVTVDLFDMGTSADAFGVFSHDFDGEPIAVGQGGRVRAGWLSAWKDRYFISVTADRDDAVARQAVVAVGQAVAGCIRREGPTPDLVAALPPEGLDAARTAYAHDHVTLDAHVRLPEGNPLGLDVRTDVAVGRYARGAAEATLVLVRFATADAAAAAAGTLASAWATAPGVTVRDGAGAWRAVTVGGRHVAAVVGANDEGTTHVLLAEALSRASAE